MGLAQLVVTAVLVEGRSKSEVARTSTRHVRATAPGCALGDAQQRRLPSAAAYQGRVGVLE